VNLFWRAAATPGRAILEARSRSRRGCSDEEDSVAAAAAWWSNTALRQQELKKTHRRALALKTRCNARGRQATNAGGEWELGRSG
jgi:hypothetical protein